MYFSSLVSPLVINSSIVFPFTLNHTTFPGSYRSGYGFFPLGDLNDLYYNEEKYPYMEKIFDSDEMDYKEFKIKAFEINYQKFHELYG